MARIRTIKPGFWKHEVLSLLPADTHILAGALLNYADDEGYFNAHPGLVKAECIPLREHSSTIPVMLQQLQKVGWIKIGRGEDGKTYGNICTFSEHQVISHKNDSKIKKIKITWEDSSNIPVPVQYPSIVKGREGKGRELNTNFPDSHKSGTQTGETVSKTEPTPPDPILVDTETYLTKKKRKLYGDQFLWFDQFWKTFAKFDGKAEAADAWLDLKVTKKLLPDILYGAEQEAKHRNILLDKGLTPKWPQGWLSGRRWEKWVELRNDTAKKQNGSNPVDYQVIGKNFGIEWKQGEYWNDFTNRVIKRLKAEEAKHEH